MFCITHIIIVKPKYTIWLSAIILMIIFFNLSSNKLEKFQGSQMTWKLIVIYCLNLYLLKSFLIFNFNFSTRRYWLIASTFIWVLLKSQRPVSWLLSLTSKYPAQDSTTRWQAKLFQVLWRSNVDVGIIYNNFVIGKIVSCYIKNIMR